MELGGRHAAGSQPSPGPSGRSPWVVVLLPRRIVPTPPPGRSARGSIIRQDIRPRTPAIEQRGPLADPLAGMRPSPDNPESCTSSGTLYAPRSSSSGIAVGFSFDWPAGPQVRVRWPWVRPHLGRMAQLWGTMPQRSERPNFWLNEVKLGVTDSVIRPWYTRAASHVIHRLFVESNPNKGTSIRGSILRRQASQHASPSFATVRGLALELLRKRG
jgi:hypothetical protein